ncbi:hypothetical protein BP5796_09180 [Coleophoma crateriformis]|uniref:Molybdenum cofactor sulfurtransferase n=1 Tax=Coleophoma crateriformis TaxID=565419 RepID=A0A3D8R398_9HELO|nr:hypothetical protein BP5796_09180 [Coleophoma crateriformis]
MSEDDREYNAKVEALRREEYPMLRNSTYLDHAGTTLYAKSLVERFSSEMIANVYGNPHSASTSSQLSTDRISITRSKVLQFFNADPEEYDIVFVANATAGIKLVAEGFRSQSGGFMYAYHQDSHTSLVGIREVATANRCLNDEEVERWLVGEERLVDFKPQCSTTLLAYPAQSNLSGKRHPLSWPGRARKHYHQRYSRTYTLLDASALVSTSPLNFKETRPDFVSLSFYKIFGFPDLGALLVRKDSGRILQLRKYFGGGTVNMVLVLNKQWHAPKMAIHESLEDGTLPFHNILALDIAIDTHERLYGSMGRIARHTAYVSHRLYEGLAGLRHANGEPVCRIHSTGFASKDPHTQGPVVAFNIKTAFGTWVSNSEVMTLATAQGFHLRTGGVCNPGGIASLLNLSPWEMQRNYSAGFKCSSDTDIYSGNITGIIRASVGAMSTIGDVDDFIAFVEKFFVEDGIKQPLWYHMGPDETINHLAVKALVVHPIDGCGAMMIPPFVDWEVKPNGLAWDKEWQLIHRVTGRVLTPQSHPRMRLIRPKIDFQTRTLRLKFENAPTQGVDLAPVISEASAPLVPEPASVSLTASICRRQLRKLSSRWMSGCSRRCCSDSEVNTFFSRILGIPCKLVRVADAESYSERAQFIPSSRVIQKPKLYHDLPSPPESDGESGSHDLSISKKDSGILVVDQNLQANASDLPAGLRSNANIVLGFSHPSHPGVWPQVQDTKSWKEIKIGEHDFSVVRCHHHSYMSASARGAELKSDELAIPGAPEREQGALAVSVLHAPSTTAVSTRGHQYPTIRIGDIVRIS